MFLQNVLDMLYQMAATVGVALDLGIIVCFLIIGVVGLSMYDTYKSH